MSFPPSSPVGSSSLLVRNNEPRRFLNRLRKRYNSKDDGLRIIFEELWSLVNYLPESVCFFQCRFHKNRLFFWYLLKRQNVLWNRLSEGAIIVFQVGCWALTPYKLVKTRSSFYQSENSWIRTEAIWFVSLRTSSSDRVWYLEILQGGLIL